MIPCGMLVPVAVWQLCELLYTCYLLTYLLTYQKGKTNLDFTEARDSEWQWHQLGHMQVCTSLQTDNHASTPPLSFLQAGCPSCRPTNSVKALKLFISYYLIIRHFFCCLLSYPCIFMDGRTESPCMVCQRPCLVFPVMPTTGVARSLGARRRRRG